VTNGQFGNALAVSSQSTKLPCDWMRRLSTLVEAALDQLSNHLHPAQRTLLEAASLLREQIEPAKEIRDGRGRLLAWQARRVRDYIDGHISGPVPVADLCLLVQRSEAHFSRSFKQTFGESPHAFLVRRRVELAARLMLASDAALRDIALQCGFSDQAHLSKQFRQSMGQTPAAWRRERKFYDSAEARASSDRQGIAGYKKPIASARATA
jgi:AraC family transcriptional regulator